MSREIKFRAWGKTEKEYIRYPFAWLSLFDSPDGLEIEESEDLVIEQYTGLKDKNGKEIYEGDIVKMPDWQVKPKYEKVRFAKLSCGFEPFVCGCFECIAPDGEEVEVIGNIHENPELLEDK